MNSQHRLFLRAASRLQDLYLQQRREARSQRGVAAEAAAQPYLEQAFRIERLLHRSRSANFMLATEQLQHKCTDALDRSIQALEASCRQLRESIPPAPNLRELFEELIAAEQEFGMIEFDHGEPRISVTTDPIELKGIHLGSFRIDLQLEQIGTYEPDNWFCIEAIDPNPAASNSDVTHPHVSSGHICAGDAWHPINNALTDGRISEFFTLVRSVLETYNPDSPYVKLEDWHGTPCADCGYVMDDDGAYWCEVCHQDFCDECFSCCQCCDSSYCSSCLTTCQACDERICEDCTSGCTECGDTCCKSCIEDDLCPTCKQGKDESDDETTTGDQTSEQTAESQSPAPPEVQATPEVQAA